MNSETYGNIKQELISSAMEGLIFTKEEAEGSIKIYNGEMTVPEYLNKVRSKKDELFG